MNHTHLLPLKSNNCGNVLQLPLAAIVNLRYIYVCICTHYMYVHTYISLSFGVYYTCMYIYDCVFLCSWFQVRTKSVETLVAIYKSVGEKVRADITKRGIPQAKLAPLLAKFDEVQESMQAQEVRVVTSMRWWRVNMCTHRDTCLVRTWK